MAGEHFSAPVATSGKLTWVVLHEKDQRIEAGAKAVLIYQRKVEVKVAVRVRRG